MTHYTTLVQRCRATNSLLADDIYAEFRRLEWELNAAKEKLREYENLHAASKKSPTNSEPAQESET